MALKFKCGNCGQELVVKFLLKGETAKCKLCGAETIVPEDALETGETATITRVLEKREKVSAELEPIINPFPLVPFSSTHVLAQIAIALVLIRVFIALLSIEFIYSQFRLIYKVKASAGVSLGETEAYFDRAFAILGLNTLSLIGLIIVLWIWIYRTYRNLPSLGVIGLGFTPRKAISCWFQKFGSFYKPYRVFTEIWQASDPEINAPQNTAWKKATCWSGILWWWITLLISTLLFYLSFPATVDSKTFSGFLVSNLLLLTSLVLTIISCALLGLIIHRIDRRQEEKHKIIQRTSIFLQTTAIN